jgi:hypothetical protein
MLETCVYVASDSSEKTEAEIETYRLQPLLRTICGWRQFYKGGNRVINCTG